MVSRRTLDLALWLAIIGLTLGLLRPALAPVHVEGFSASVVAIGLHIAQGSVGDFMPFAPFNTDYFGLTKFGAALGVAGLSPLLGGDGAMRLLMQLGLLLILASSAYLVRAWSGARWSIIASALLIVPGIAESSFYFNDNVPAAALLLPGLALLVRWSSLPAAAMAGVLIGCAVSVRADVVLVAVMAVPLILWPRGPRKLLLATGISGACAIATLFAVFAMAGVTPLDVLRVGSFAVKLWDRPLQLFRQLNEFLYFIGLPGMAFLLLGAMQLRREKRWHRLALLGGVPLAFNIIMLGTLWQARQFLVLAPFLVSLVAYAAESSFRDVRAGRPLFPAVLAAFCLLILSGPVRGLAYSDGPHEYFGRFAGVKLWKDWQARVREDFDRIDRLIDQASTRRPLLVLTDGWNDDRYLHLRLVERGFRRIALPTPCPMLGEGFRRNDRTVIQLTLRTPFVRNWSALQAPRLEQVAIPCATHFAGARIVLLADRERVAKLLPGAVPNEPAQRQIKSSGMDIVAVPLNAVTLSTLSESYRRTAIIAPGPTTIGEAQALLASRTAFSR